MESRTARDGLLFGPVAAAIFFAGVGGLPWFFPGYSAVRQTVSEIGERGSPTQDSFAVVLYLVAVSLCPFAYALRKASTDGGHGSLAAYLTGFMALLTAGLAACPLPHPLHNILGPLEIIGYQAPLAFALAWRHDVQSTGMVRFSWLMFAMLWISLLLNLVTFDRHSSWWLHIQPYYGLVQRSLFVAWFSWCAGIGIMLWQRPTDADALER